MNQSKFQSLLKYYLSCMDAEQALQLSLRKNQEHQTYIFPAADIQGELFTQALPELKVPLSNVKERNFILQRSADQETLVDLHYGFPIFKDERDMISPLFFVEVSANFTDNDILSIIPRSKNLSVNRAYFFNHYNAEEIQEICDELEGEFGSFDARMKAVKKYIPSEALIEKAILFRTNKGGTKDKLRYELMQIFKNGDALGKPSALRSYVQGAQEFNGQRKLSILEISTLNEQQEDAVRKGLQAPLNPGILLHGKKQIFWDVDSYIHIVMRHIKDYQLGQNKQKTSFPYKIGDLKTLIEKILSNVKDEYKLHVLKKPESHFTRAGRRAVFFNGDHYNLKIDPSGRLFQFHPRGWN